MTTQTQLVSGLAGAIGCSFRNLQNQLVFVEYGGKLSRLNLTPAASVVSQGTAILKGTWSFDLDNGTEIASPGNDIWWEQMTAVARRMTPQNSARILNLGSVDFNTLGADSLQALPYTTTPIPGNNDASNKLVTGDVFAVRTNQGNYAKVKVVNYDYNMSIQWVTYRLDPAYAVLGTGYANPEDVKVSQDGVHAYVSERSGNLLRVNLSNANRAAATVVSSGMTAPHQLALDEAHNTAYVVEFANPGHLWRVNLGNGSRSAVASNLENAIGLVLSADLQYAYITEQTAGADKGRISRIQLNNGARTVLATGRSNPFFLHWSDAAQTALLCAERDPVNQIVSLSPGGGAVTVVAAGVPFRPSSVAAISNGRLLVCSDQVIERVDYTQPMLADGVLLMGLGFVPCDKVLPSGLATVNDVGYPYQVTNAPFGGRIPVMINFQRAATEGGVYYRVKVDGTPRLDSWSDYKWIAGHWQIQPVSPLSVGGNPGYYRVHPLSELFLWMNPSWGMYFDSTSLTNGLHDIVVEVCAADGSVIETSPVLTIMVNNQHCSATLAVPIISGVGADPNCGMLHYGTKTNPIPVNMAMTATHPANYANYSFSLIRGINSVMSTGGPVPAPAAPLTATVATLLGKCAVGGFAEYLYVSTTIQNGWGRQSQYDASAAVAFVLAP